MELRRKAWPITTAIWSRSQISYKPLCVDRTSYTNQDKLQRHNILIYGIHLCMFLLSSYWIKKFLHTPSNFSRRNCIISRLIVSSSNLSTPRRSEINCIKRYTQRYTLYHFRVHLNIFIWSFQGAFLKYIWSIRRLCTLGAIHTTGWFHVKCVPLHFSIPNIRRNKVFFVSEKHSIPSN